MSELKLSNTEALLAEGTPEIIDVKDIPTASIAGSLTLARAVAEDSMGSNRYGIPRNFYVPTSDLSEIKTSGMHDFVISKDSEYWNGLDYARIIGVEILEAHARSEGHEDYTSLLRASRSDHEERPPHDSDPAYFRLYDGGVIFDMEDPVDNEVLPDWNGLISRYGENDPVVQNYFEKLDANLRVDAAAHFRYLSPTVRLLFETDEIETDKIVRICNALSNYLLNNGYEPAPSGIVVAEVKDGSVNEIRTV